MSHVDENNYLIVQYDMLIHEFTKSFRRGTPSFVDIITPYLSNFKLPMKWPTFSSNFLNISDIDSFQDLLRLLRLNQVRIRVMTLSTDAEIEKNMRGGYIEGKHNFLNYLRHIGCEIFFSTLNHGKITITSQAVLFGSANYTITGLDADKQWNIGHYFPKTKDGDYDKKKEYVDKKFEDLQIVKWI